MSSPRILLCFHFTMGGRILQGFQHLSFADEDRDDPVHRQKTAIIADFLFAMARAFRPPLQGSRNHSEEGCQKSLLMLVFRKGRLCERNPSGVSFAFLIISFATFLKVAKLAQLVEKTFSTSWKGSFRLTERTFFILQAACELPFG